jgi:pyruvate,orthophosphate dikinase
VGVAIAVIALDPKAVKRLSAAGSAILVRRDTATVGMALSAGILTASGGRTSQAAVVPSGRQGMPRRLSGVRNRDHRKCRIGGMLFNEGDFLSLDGNTGSVYSGVSSH